MVIQVISIRSPKKTKESVLELIRAMKNEIKERYNIDVTGISITTGDMYGYVTYLVGVPNNIPESEVEKLAKVIMLSLIPAKWTLLKNEELVGYHWAKCGREVCELELLK